MKIFFPLVLIFGLVCKANAIDVIYWSPYMCEGHIYNFDLTKSQYKIYSRIDVTDKKNGTYTSYQYTEGGLELIAGKNYKFISDGPDNEIVMDFTDSNKPVMRSPTMGRANFIKCDSEESKNFENSAEKHFKKCGRQTVNCKNL